MDVENLSKDLARVSTETMADIVELRLREFIKKKAFKPGDALPKEMELVEALGVSRNVVREALSRLRMLGMIETRKKRGMILASPDVLGTFERVLDPLIIDDQILQDLFELRLALEMGLAELLFLRKTDKDIAELEKIAIDEKQDGEQRFRVKNEIAFHGKLYEITGNNTLKRFQTMLMPVFGYVTTLEKDRTYQSGKVTHLDLVNILKNGTKEDFKTGMYEHLKPHFDGLAKKK
jgi:GntR family transcriptional repressor for pyruvate dehydrogenase complex